MLVAPKFLIAIRNAATGQAQAFGGAALSVWSTLMELAWSSLIAPAMLMFQSRSVLQVLLGADGGWPTGDRDEESISLRHAWAASWWITATGVLALVASAVFASSLVFWLAPVAVPMIVTPFLIFISSSPASGRAAARLGLFATPMELEPMTVILERKAILTRWRAVAARHEVPREDDRQMDRPQVDEVETVPSA